MVDVQEGMFQIHPSLYRGPHLLETLRDLLAQARAAGATVIHVQHDGAEPDHPLRPSGSGWPLHAVVAPQPGEMVIRKRHSDSFHETELHKELAARGIRHLVVAGIQSDYCVDTTCRRAFSLGYSVTLVADGHSTWDDPSCGAAQIVAHHNEVLGNGFARVIPAREVNFGKTGAQRKAGMHR